MINQTKKLLYNHHPLKNETYNFDAEITNLNHILKIHFKFSKENLEF